MTPLRADQELVRKYVAGKSDDAFRALVARHVHLVYGTAYRQTGDRGLAEEITQNVFVALAQKAPRLAGVRTLGGWLHRTAVLESKARIRAELRRRRREDRAVEQAQIPEEGASHLQEMLPLLDEGLLNLRDKDRLVLVLRFFEDRSLRDVGEVLGLDEDAARKRVARALERLTGFFRTRGVTAAGASMGTTLTVAGGQVVPAGVVASAAQAGLCAGSGSGVFNLLLFQAMSLNKTQSGIIACLIAAAPLLLVDGVKARMHEERVATERRLSVLRSETMEVERERAETERLLAQLRVALEDSEQRLGQLQSQTVANAPRPEYRWNESSPVLRVPKAFLEKLSLTAVANRRGHLTEEIKAALQMSEPEAQAVQAAIDSFVLKFNAEQGRTLTLVAPEPTDLAGHAPEETRVFLVSALGAELPRLRVELFVDLEAALGQQRFELFRRAMRNWMPLDDEYKGMNSGMAVFNFEHRVIFYRPTPGRDWLDWQIRKPNGEMMRFSVQREDIPPAFLPYMRDWIAIANSPDTAEPK